MTIDNPTFKSLMGLKKRFVDESDISLDKNWTRDIVPEYGPEKFQLDYRKSKIEIRKYSFNHRVRTSIVLVRYCSCRDHTNPDGSVIRGAHIHLYCEDYGDKVAFEVSRVLGIDPTSASREEVLYALMKYCNIEKVNIQGVLEI